MTRAGERTTLECDAVACDDIGRGREDLLVLESFLGGFGEAVVSNSLRPLLDLGRGRAEREASWPAGAP